jgi:putative transcriptional regulator
MHPPEETLLALASGEADLPLRATVEGHLSSCPACRATLGELTAAGAALLRGLPSGPPPDPLWEKILSRVAPGDREPASALDPLAALPLPAGTRRELPPSRDLRWRSAWAPKARYALLARERATGTLLFVGHMPPGRHFPRHRHLGREDVLVLAGGYEDQRGRYEAGEYAVYEPGSEHRPATEPGEECWILFRLEAPVRFLGWRGALQRLLTRLS